MHIHSADAYAFDFVVESDIEELNRVLLGVSEYGSPPGWGQQMGMHPGSRNINHAQQNWGTLSGVDTEVFDSVSVFVLQFPQIPEVVVPLLVGRTEREQANEDEVVDADESNERLVDSNGLQQELERIWMETFSDRMPGLLSEFSSGQFPISKQPPLTLFSGQIMTRSLDDVFARPSAGAKGWEYVASDDFVENLRDGQFCAKFGIQPHGLISLNMATEHYLMLTAQSKSSVSGTQILHDSYATIGFLSEDDPMLIQHIGWDVPMNDPMDDIPEEVREKMPEDIESSARSREPLPNYRAAHNSMNLIPLLFYFYWFRSRIYQTAQFGQILRQIPVGVGENHDSGEIIDFLQNREVEFYSQYVQFLDRVESARSMIENSSKETLGSPREHGVPLKPEQTPPVHRENGNLDIFDYHSGLFEVLRDDISSAIEDAEDRFGDLENRYEIVLGELNQQLDLIISEQNRSLSESSLELQEEMKELNQTSIDLQEDVTRLTWVLAILTILLVFDAFGQLFTDLFSWILLWVSQFL